MKPFQQLAESLEVAFGPAIQADYNTENDVLEIRIGNACALFNADGELIGGHSRPRKGGRGEETKMK